MKIGFTGTREGMSPRQQNEIGHFLSAHHDWWSDNPVNQAHHGECIGADSDFHELARINGFEVWGHPSTLTTRNLGLTGFAFQHDPIKPVTRDHHIVDQTELLIATPLDLEKVRSGTWTTVRWARKRKRYIFIVYPNGSLQIEFEDGRIFFRGMWVSLEQIPLLGHGGGSVDLPDPKW